MLWYISELSASHLSRATAIFVVDCCQYGPRWMFGLKMELMACAGLVGGTTEQSCILRDLICKYHWYDVIMNCLHYTSAVPQPFLLLIAANLAQAGFLGWKWSLWPVPAWLEVQRSIAVFSLTLYDSINDMKHFKTVCITPQPLRSNFCCWLLLIWPKLDCWVENGAYGLCRFGWLYNGEKLYFPWPYMLVSMLWYISELSASHLSRATAIFVVDCCQYGPSWMFGLKMELMACAGLVGGTTEHSCLFNDLIW